VFRQKREWQACIRRETRTVPFKDQVILQPSLNHEVGVYLDTSKNHVKGVLSIKGEDGGLSLSVCSKHTVLAMPRSVRSSRSARSRYTEKEIARMKILNFVDDLGILLICRPLFSLLHLDIVNLFDDIGISLLMRPLRYLYRFAEFVIQLTEA